MRVAILPSGALFADAASSDDEASDGLSAAARVRVARAFARGPGHALLDLGATELDAPLSPPLTFLRDLGRAFVTRLCAVPDLEERRERAEVDCPPDERARLAGAVPPKALKAHARIALTGTPVENRLGDLWSIYDFLDPGLLGSAREFSAFAKGLADRTDDSYAPLRRLIQPYLLRRLKTDRAIVADLPDKTEVKAFCLLSSAQAALYQKTVDELERAIAGLTQGIERRGLVLAYLMRFKQICNHPAHWLGEGAWDEAGSGKLARLREIVDAVAAKQEGARVHAISRGDRAAGSVPDGPVRPPRARAAR